MRILIKNSEVEELLSDKKYNFPLYSTQLMNLANSNSQASRAKNVGQLSDLIQEFEGNTLAEWEEWYLKKHPNTIDVAAKKVFEMLQKLKESINQTDEKTVRDWTERLVITQTYSGLKFQEAILKKISLESNKKYRLASPHEESQGIDGFIGNRPVSIKPISYKVKRGLNETIDIPIIYYEKNKTRVKIEFDESIIS